MESPHRQPVRPILAAALLAAVGLSAACGGPADAPPAHDRGEDDERIAPRRLDLHGDAARSFELLDTASELRDAFSDGTARFAPADPFRQASLMFRAPEGTRLEWRTPNSGRWRPVEVTWREGQRHVGRIITDRSAGRLLLRTSASLEHLYLEFSAEVTARLDAPLTRQLPRAGVEPDSPDGLRTRPQLQAPSSLVISRSQWGARDPDKVCGRAHDPYRMTIHHTASPSDDGGDPAARMRQMQAFHIDNRGWCDIGYHFVVSQSGKIYQGRSTEKRTGAHVGGENTGNIGVSLIGNFENQTVDNTQFTAATKIVNWVHEEYSIPLTRDKFKGHTEWPNQSTACPGTNLRSRLKELANKSKNLGSDPGTWKVEIAAGIVGGHNPYQQGSSAEVSDALPGHDVEAEIVVTNASDQAIEDVQLGYAIEEPYLRATGYTIYDDHPAHDTSTWEVNDADSAQSNPSDSEFGKSGKLTLHSFSAGESKRIVVDLESREYSLGRTRHPDIRGWVRQIKDVYETKESWDASPSTDKVGDDLRARAQLDVPSENQWHFENTETQENLEGWRGCCEGDYERLALNHKDGLLAMKVTGGDPQLISPRWLRVDADRLDQLVMRVRAHDGVHQKAIYWRRQGESFSDDKRVRFEAPGDGEFHTLVVPIGEHPQWSGEIIGLRIDPLDDRAPASEATAWYDIDGAYFQSSDGSEVTSVDELAFGDGTTVELLGNYDQPDDNNDNDDRQNDMQKPSNDDDGDKSDPENDDQGRNLRAGVDENVVVKGGGCSAAGGSSPVGGAWLLGLLVPLYLLRRNRACRPG